jgi:hypothetical protein
MPTYSIDPLYPDRIRCEACHAQLCPVPAGTALDPTPLTAWQVAKSLPDAGPAVWHHEAVCPEGRGGGWIRWLLGKVWWCGRALFKFLLDQCLPVGTNLLAILLIAAAYFFALAVEAMLPRTEKGVLDAVLGLTCLALDAGLRKAFLHESLLAFDKGGRLIYVPVWMWGVVWIFVGTGKVAWALLN